jgi:hypothetical protein
MTDNKDTKISTESKPSPFLSQNVWLKGVGGIILLIGLFPEFYKSNNGTLNFILLTVIFLAVVTYGVKLIKGFFKSIWNS